MYLKLFLSLYENVVFYCVVNPSRQHRGILCSCIILEQMNPDALSVLPRPFERSQRWMLRLEGALGPEQTFTTSPVKGFTSEVQLTQERNLYQIDTVKQFTSEVNRPSLPSLFHHGVHFSHCSYEQ